MYIWSGGEISRREGEGGTQDPDEEERDNQESLAGPGGEGGDDGPPPLQGYCQHGQHAGRHLANTLQ